MMTRNTKIALGCGGAGCLGLILIVIVFVVLIVSGTIKAPGLYDASRNSNYNYNYNSNSNSSNSNTNDNLNSNSTSDSSDDSSSMSDDDKHMLFQAVATAQDQALIRRVWEKLGLVKANGSPSDEYQQFVKEHIAWIFKNTAFIQTINTPEKARAYVEAHIDD